MEQAPVAQHYENPRFGCLMDEVELSVDGVNGKSCAPQCDLTHPCPDETRGSYAEPKCAVQDEQGNKFCVLTCVPFFTKMYLPQNMGNLNAFLK